MPDFFVYLLKINVVISLFYLGYYFLLRKLTFYSLNRCYLLFSILFSAVFPFLHIPSLFSKPEIINYDILFVGDTITNLPQVPDTQFSIWTVLMGLYWLLVIVGGLKLLVRLVSLYRIHLKSSPQLWQGYKFNNLKSENAPFSFLTTIYLNFKNHTEQELHTILRHEQVHTKNLHSFDILLIEIWSIFFWFNPISWLLKRAINVNIEFIADREVVNQGVSQENYQNSLLHFAVQSQNLPLVNQFSFLSLKSRITMMNRKQSSKKQLGKYFLIIPIIIFSLFLFGVSKAYKASESAEVFFQEQKQELQDERHLEKDSRPSQKVSKAKTISVDTIEKAKVDSARSKLKDVLIVINGIVQEKDIYGLEFDITPDDIASMTVLKGGQAVAIYGNKAINGAILITTKMRSEVKDESTSILKEKVTTIKSDTVIIAGKNFLKSNENVFSDKPAPIYIVEGKEVDAAALEKIGANQIKAIEVLKGEKAIAVYGGKAINGVVEISLH